MSITEFSKKKLRGEKLSMVTCYDFTTAQIIAETPIDMILVGDSLAMTMHGHPTTLPATEQLMEIHTQAVCRGASNKFVVADFPFLSHRKGKESALQCAEKLMRAGASAVKIEGVQGHQDVIHYLIESGIPVMGHLGLTPQSVHQLGGFKVQGKTDDQQSLILNQAIELQKLGCFSIVLECIPTQLGYEITRRLQIPTIGIGAGPDTDGQVLVMQDLLGLAAGRRPKFVRTFLDGRSQFLDAFERFHRSVKEGSFPAKEESYGNTLSVQRPEVLL